MKKCIFVFAILFSLKGYSQDPNSVWCFGDSSGIDFSNITNPQPIHSIVKSRGSCASICDSNGLLLFYSSYTPPQVNPLNGDVYNRDNQLMLNGDSIFYRSWYQEVVIVPLPDDSTKYYLFSVGESTIFGLYYSVIDMTLDSGNGALVLKNVQLNNYKARDGLIAVKHGNGRDWWIISERWDVANNEFTEHLLTPTGVSGPFIQYSGVATAHGFYFVSFSSSGTKFVAMNPNGLMELFDFDRCTGAINLNQIISQEVGAAPYPYFVGCSFSPNENYLYISSQGVQHPTYLIQYDITTPVISATADTIWSYNTTEEAGGQLKLAPDGKIYMACAYYDGLNYNYPYPDSTFNTVNNNLSVINYPDSPGVACGFTPFSFNLGAGRCYWGLPNNPDYELGALVNSMCDTVTAVAAVGSGSKQEELHVFYHAGWQVAFINGEGLRGRKFSLQVFDLFGRVIYSEEGSLSSAYFTKDLPFDAFANGMYIVTLRTDKEVLSKKFVKE